MPIDSTGRDTRAMTPVQSAEKAIRDALAESADYAKAMRLGHFRWALSIEEKRGLTGYPPDLVSMALLSIDGAALTALLDELESLRRDAGRYRYLRNEAWGCGKRKRSDVHVCQLGPGVLLSSVTELAEEALDTAIDAAMKENRE